MLSKQRVSMLTCIGLDRHKLWLLHLCPVPLGLLGRLEAGVHLLLRAGLDLVHGLVVLRGTAAAWVSSIGQQPVQAVPLPKAHAHWNEEAVGDTSAII